MIDYSRDDDNTRLCIGPIDDRFHEPYLMLEDFDYYDDADYEYVDMRGEIRRPDLGIVIPVTVQYDGSVLLGNPPVDKIPSVEFAEQYVGERFSLRNSPSKILACP